MPHLVPMGRIRLHMSSASLRSVFVLRGKQKRHFPNMKTGSGKQRRPSSSETPYPDLAHRLTKATKKDRFLAEHTFRGPSPHFPSFPPAPYHPLPRTLPLPKHRVGTESGLCGSRAIHGHPGPGARAPGVGPFPLHPPYLSITLRGNPGVGAFRAAPPRRSCLSSGRLLDRVPFAS